MASLSYFKLFYLMGANHNKDQNLNKDQHVKVYLTLNKRFHYAGQMVEGAVHITCTSDRPYRVLNIRIEGREEVYWSEGSLSNEHRTYYSDKRQTYNMEIELATFNMGIMRGHYTYPFSILLPASKPASVYFNALNFITYKISAVIPRFDDSTSDQLFKRLLHVRQPPRGILSNLKGQATSESISCTCCCSCGTCNLTLETDVACLNYGQVFHARGNIDASMSKTEIKNYKLVLRERTTRCASTIFGCENHYVVNQDYDLFNFRKNISQGSSEKFDIKVSISQSVTGYTAIGNIISRAYFVTLVAEVHCCYSNPCIELFAILNTTIEPAIREDEQRPAPEGWNPQVAPPAILHNLPPYVYRPANKIKFRNQVGQSVNMGEQMNQVLSERMMSL